MERPASEHKYSEVEISPKEARASAPGRICLSGESLDWMVNGPSIVAAINLRTYVYIRELPLNVSSFAIRSEELEKRGRIVSYKGLREYQDININHIQASLKVFEETGTNLTPISVDVKTFLPIRAGVSSSASLILATLGSLKQYYESKLTVDDLCTLSHRVESEQLKTGAGLMDFYACLHGGIRYLNCSSEPPYSEESAKIADIKIVLVDTLSPHDTRTFISTKRQRFNEKDPSIMRYAQLTTSLVEEFKPLLRDFRGNIKDIGKCIYRSHQYLRNYMHCSTELLDECVEVSMQNGAYGAKLTGTGLGGCMFALAPIDSAPQLLRKLQTLPVKAQIVDFTQEGLRLEQSPLN